MHNLDTMWHWHAGMGWASGCRVSNQFFSLPLWVCNGNGNGNNDKMWLAARGQGLSKCLLCIKPVVLSITITIDVITINVMYYGNNDTMWQACSQAVMSWASEQVFAVHQTSCSQRTINCFLPRSSRVNQQKISSPLVHQCLVLETPLAFYQRPNILWSLWIERSSSYQKYVASQGVRSPYKRIH